MTKHERELIEKARSLFNENRDHTHHASFNAADVLAIVRKDINSMFRVVDSFEDSTGKNVLFINLGDSYDRTLMWNDSRGFFWSSVAYETESLIDWQECVEALNKLDFDSETDSRATYLGTIQTLTPSGKYYNPVACSNVDACDTCRVNEGPCCDDLLCSGNECCEVCLDSRWWSRVEAEAERHGLTIETAEDCPTDILVVEYK